jgi:hypothetical protein
LANNTRFTALLNAVAYEVTPDEDLLVVTKSGNVLQIDAGYWAAVGTLERTDGQEWFAAEHVAYSVVERSA